MWYTATVIMWLRFKEGPQDYYPLEENHLLIYAETPDRALEEAESIARECEGDDGGSLRCDRRPAERVFGSIRRLIACEDPPATPGHGTELTYQFMLAESKEAFDALLAGKDARILLKEGNDADLA